jgi:hypothetical protein
LSGFDKTTHLVDISHVKQVCDVKDRTVELINGLTMKSKTLMVVSLLLRLDQWHDGMLSLSLLTNAYNSFAIQKGISAESACSVQRMLDELQAYCIMETTNHRSSAKVSQAHRIIISISGLKLFSPIFMLGQLSTSCGRLSRDSSGLGKHLAI